MHRRIGSLQRHAALTLAHYHVIVTSFHWAYLIADDGFFSKEIKLVQKWNFRSKYSQVIISKVWEELVLDPLQVPQFQRKYMHSRTFRAIHSFQVHHFGQRTDIYICETNFILTIFLDLAIVACQIILIRRHLFPLVGALFKELVICLLCFCKFSWTL